MNRSIEEGGEGGKPFYPIDCPRGWPKIGPPRSTSCQERELAKGVCNRWGGGGNCLREKFFWHAVDAAYEERDLNLARKRDNILEKQNRGGGKKKRSRGVR